MNAEIGAEAALFPEKEYISGILLAVQPASRASMFDHLSSLRSLWSNTPT